MHTARAFERFEAAPRPGSSLSHTARALERFEAAPRPGSPLLHATRALRSRSAIERCQRRRGAAIFVSMDRSRHEVRTNPRGLRAVTAARASGLACAALLAFNSGEAGRGIGPETGHGLGRGIEAGRGLGVGRGIAAGHGLGVGHGI